MKIFIYYCQAALLEIFFNFFNFFNYSKRRTRRYLFIIFGPKSSDIFLIILIFLIIETPISYLFIMAGGALFD